MRERGFNGAEKERKIVKIMIKEYARQVMHNAVAYHLLTDA